MARKSGNTPNLYELAGAKTEVTYSTSSINGQPRFHYKDATRDKNFAGDQIVVKSSVFGKEVTVMLEGLADGPDLRFTLIVPDVNLQDDTEAKIRTFGVLTLSRNTLGGPKLVKGQVQTYKVTGLRGTAKSVLF